MKTDCFAYRERGCIALIENVCEYGDCPFYKTVEQVNIERKRALARLGIIKKTKDMDYSRKIIFNGRRFNKRELSEYLGISYDYLLRLLKEGRDIDEIAKAPIIIRKEYEYDGKMLSCRQVARMAGLSEGDTRRKLKKGMSVKQILALYAKKEADKNEKKI